MAPLEIYGMQPSAPCRIVEMTAECLGLEYEFKMVDLMAGEHKKPEFLAMNPMHNIPTVKDGDFVMNESRAIAAYLVNKYGKDDNYNLISLNYRNGNESHKLLLERLRKKVSFI